MALTSPPGPPTLPGFAAPERVVLCRDVVAGVALHPAVAAWLERRFPAGPTPPQVGGWPHLAAGRHTLIAAPTGSGKTLAGFLMAIDALYRDHAAGRDVRAARVLYVSPLKALAVDIAENLERPLAEIAAVAAELGHSAPDLSVGVRTGDTSPAARAAMVRRPPTFVITTPESLYLLLTAQRSREVLAGIETVIVDEIHALARDKRGAHLALSLERLEHVCRRPPVRVGLSATQKPVEAMADLLVGARDGPDGKADRVVVDVGHQRDLDLALELPGGELEAAVSHSQMGEVLTRIAALVDGHRTTLVFVNTRRLAERLAHQLAEHLGDDAVAAHHGSLSRERRQRVEQRLRAGDLRALVATASLELGIDIGPVELVCQIGSPRSIATFLQRVGRSNHTRVGTPKGRLFPLTRDELVESVALLAAIAGGRLDRVEPPEAPLDILAQQLVAEAAAESWRTDDLYELVRRAHHYRDLPREDFDEVVALAAQGIRTGRGPRGAHLHHDAINGEVRGRRGARLAALTSGGAIPETGDFRVVLEPGETFIGTVNEDWATESMAGDIFLLGTHSWQIRRVTAGTVRVVDAEGKPPTVPFWLGEAPARTAELSEEVSAIRALVERAVVAASPGTAVAELAAVPGVGRAAAEAVAAYLSTGRVQLGVMPTHENLVVERFFDDTGGFQLVIHSPHGGRINRAMGYALRKKFCQRFNFELQASATDDAIVISLGPHHSFPLEDIPHYLRSATIGETLTQAVLDQPAFISRWRWNLNRALIVPRNRGGRRNPPPIQRMEADDIMAAVFPAAAACQENVIYPIEIPDHPIVRQTLHDTLTEGLDATGLAELWRRIEAGDVVLHSRDTHEPSVLAHEILSARPYAFLDDGEAIDRRTNAVSREIGLRTDPGDLAVLDPDAVVRVREEVAPALETPDELHDHLSMLVLSARVPDAEPLLRELEARGRAARVPATGPMPERWHTAEGTAAVAALLGEEPGEERDRAVAELLRGHLEILSPTTAGDLADRCGFAEGVVAAGLAALEAEGAVVQGRFTRPEAPEPEWASRRLLARMHAYSRQRRRRQARPVSPEQFVRFLLRWQHVAPGNHVRGRAGLVRIVEQLQGWEVPVAAWEPDVLAARVQDYRPELLDDLCRTGEVSWLRLRPPAGADPQRRGAGPSKATPVALAFRNDLDWLLAAARATGAPPRPDRGALAEVLEVLDERGAQFAGDLARATGRLATQVEDALWEGVARGLVAADGFGAVRALTAGVRRSAHRGRGVSRLRRGAPSPTLGDGRWDLVGDPTCSPEREDLAEAVADQLLVRWGVVFHDLAVHDASGLAWRDLQWALRRLEDRGLVRGGRFVEGFSGEQFALPAAVEALAAVRRAAPTESTVTISGADPLNLTGVVLPGPRVPARRAERVELPV